MRKLLLAGFAVAALVATGSANAADLGPRPAYKAPPVAVPPPLPSWTGFYIGGDVGLRATSIDWSTTGHTIAGGVIPPTTATAADYDSVAFRFGGYAGYNWQFAPQWVIGIEGDGGSADKTKTVFNSIVPGNANLLLGGPPLGTGDFTSVRTTWDASARARLGFLVTPTVMIYATGGAAWQHFELSSVCNSSCPAIGATPTSITASDTKTGWTVGGGLETMLWRNWLLRVEYRFADFGHFAFNPAFTLSPGIFDVFTTDFRLRTHTALFGIAYKFDWGKGKAPVVARY
jgi:outer membrane immunogenic protein